ncbi:hypothetical protein [Paenibacillus arenilitoris]|uniref:CbiN domain protein n=1 Tax=Paenibacillus arenilitoris TaxID=2772299 RepID=A0A927H731_9BACL|nr:hypothetical protein [Paenibacillus arenilitoris]MBD2869179.1 hypothetical protein [Paenibacillus arenilitoris]
MLFSLMLLFLFTIFYPNASYALSCANIPPIETAYERYDGVVVGKVEEIVATSVSNELQVKVLRSFKGIEAQSLTIQEDITWGSWHGPSVKGETYLFFLYEKATGWENPLCSPTEKVADQADVDPYLEGKDIPLKPAPQAKSMVIESSNNAVPSQANWMAITVSLLFIGFVLFRFIHYLKKR